MKLFGSRKTDNIEKLSDIVSQTGAMLNSIEFQMPDKASQDDFKQMYRDASKLKNSFYVRLDPQNSFYKQLDNKLTTDLQDIQNKAYQLLKTGESGALELPKTGGDDDSLDRLFKEYIDEEQKLLNKNM